MNDFTTDISAAPVETPSTVLDTETDTRPSGGGAPRTLPDDAKAPSLRDTISAVVKEEDADRQKAEVKPDDAKPEGTRDAKDAKEPKADDKDDGKAKADRAPDGKFAAKPKEGEAEAATVAKPEAVNDANATAKAEEKTGEGKHYQEPPKNFLPDSKEMWRNVPRPVRRDIEIMVREQGEAMERNRETVERYETLRPFDEMARSNGRDLRESLAKINQVETALQRDVVYGLDQILREIGPRKQDGSAVSIYELAAHIVQQGPQAHQQRMSQVQQSQPAQPDPRVEQQERELADTRARLIALEVIAPFKAEHPRYDELQEPIATILKSGMISPSLSAPERLEAAYVMADRLNPASAPPAETEAPAPESRAADSLNGQKSIRSAPGAVSDDMEPERGGSITDILRDEMKRMRRS